MTGFTASRIIWLLFHRHQRRLKILLSLVDIVLTSVAFEAAYATRQWPDLFSKEFFFTPQQHTLLLGFCLLTWVGIGYWLDVYDGLGSTQLSAVLRNSFRQAGLGALLLIVFSYLLHLDVSRGFVILFGIFGWLLLSAFRLHTRHVSGLFRRLVSAEQFVLIVGTGPRARRLGESIESAPGQAVRIRGFLSETPCPDCCAVELAGTYPVYAPGDLSSLLRRYVIDDVLIAVDPEHLPQLGDLFERCDLEGVRTRLTLDFFARAHSGLRVEVLDDTPLLTLTRVPDDEIKLLVKRLVDVVLASVAVVLVAPLMIVTAIAIRLTSPGPAIFRQRRLGLNGRPFVFYKFRSMVADAELRKSEVIHLSRRQLATKIPNDPRVTPIGGFLRKYSIDELPQLFNVLRGDMSLVGPRPAIPSEVEQYQAWQRKRMRMRPGLTCLWAVNGRDSVDFETWMRMDLRYIDNWSLFLDWQIMLKTIPQVLLGRGAS